MNALKEVQKGGASNKKKPSKLESLSLAATNLN